MMVTKQCGSAWRQSWETLRTFTSGQTWSLPSTSVILADKYGFCHQRSHRNFFLCTVIASLPYTRLSDLTPWPWERKHLQYKTKFERSLCCSTVRYLLRDKKSTLMSIFLMLSRRFLESRHQADCSPTEPPAVGSGAPDTVLISRLWAPDNSSSRSRWAVGSICWGSSAEASLRKLFHYHIFFFWGGVWRVRGGGRGKCIFTPIYRPATAQFTVHYRWRNHFGGGGGEG
jgi:hypothetical protein